MKRKILLATSNEGKIKQLKEFFKTQPVEVVSLLDLAEKIEPPEEPFDSLEFNALLKAKYYSEKTGLTTLADDSGLFIDALDGWPGVHSARVADSAEGRIQIVLEKMNGQKDRTARFRAVLAFYDPTEKIQFLSSGETEGEVTGEPVQSTGGFGYDPIFFAKDAGKTYSQMTTEESNKWSHRGKALNKMEYFLKKQYGARNLVVPAALVIQEGKVLMILRNDPHRPQYHRHWEFPGGSVEFKEQMLDNVIRETEEETGLQVEPLKLLQHIAVEWQEFPTFAYQVYLVPYVCKVVGGKLAPRDEEALDAQWFTLGEVTNYPLVGENARMFEKLLPELEETIKNYNL